ncbi:MAG: LytTR family transcriptional regulator DNA-binding domain-containing protein [Phenylobacterium sp.]|uniref:LytTR family DNA-binding domain-containing protein n=1 Tax=Phenylobacterium sp. TaxID=1871053 RepID=UPI001A44C5E2|nr:LytTR family DNA-binding domain-containing protein [Phenylobacterium sp.]MBL8554446.1 LytTR family transcriptional regulator DNA-binding domain-containing protein [Phenylobacterium sp.]
MRDLLRRFTPYDETGGYLRGFVIALAAAAFLTFAGAFGTGDAPFGVRAAYWLTLMVVGYVFGSFIVRFFFHGARRSWPTWLRVVAASLLMAIPFTALVSVGSSLFFGSRMQPASLPVLFVPVLSVCLALTAINTIVETRRTAITHASPQPPKFLERLPLKLRGADVWAVEAEDHYLRLHTSKGQDLILMRLADAVAELEGIEGAQVHRSWWVARDAITDAKRGDGRATLTLKDGAEVPVSRTYAGLLRERGWI